MSSLLNYELFNNILKGLSDGNWRTNLDATVPLDDIILPVLHLNYVIWRLIMVLFFYPDLDLHQ